jgi:hypothetical protein
VNETGPRVRHETAELSVALALVDEWVDCVTETWRIVSNHIQRSEVILYSYLEDY